MRKIYFPLFIFFVFASCTTKIGYIGKSLTPTKNVDVYVTEGSIKQPFEYIGKSHVSEMSLLSPEKIQRKSIQKAREKGADAILIIDYYQFNPAASISSTFITDSIGKMRVTTGNSTVRSGSSTGYDIFFLKYNK